MTNKSIIEAYALISSHEKPRSIACFVWMCAGITLLTLILFTLPLFPFSFVKEQALALTCLLGGCVAIIWTALTTLLIVRDKRKELKKLLGEAIKAKDLEVGFYGHPDVLKIFKKA